MTRSRKLAFAAVAVALNLLALEFMCWLTWERIVALAEKRHAGIDVTRNALQEPNVGYLLRPDHCESIAYGRHDPSSYKSGTPAWQLCGNAKGFRQPDFETVKPPGTFRIVCMGDSNTMGQGVSHDLTFCARLARKLQRASRQPGLRFEAVNAGIWGFASYQGLIVYEKYVRHWNPDLVTVGYGTNDRAPLDEHRSRFRDRLVYSFPGEEPKVLLEPIRASGLYTLKILSYVRRQYQEMRLSARRPRTKMYEHHSLTDRRATPAEYRENIGTLLDRIRADGARAIAIGVGNREPEYRNTLKRVTAERGVPYVAVWERFEELDPEVRAGRRYCDEKKMLESWFTPGAFASRSWWSRYLTSDGGHPSVIGHDIITELLFDVIRDRGFAGPLDALPPEETCSTERGAGISDSSEPDAPW